MSLQFILGGSGSGKSTALYDQVIRQSAENEKDMILLIVPEQYTMQTQRYIVENHPSHGVMNVDILSFERLAYRVFEELGTSVGTVLDDTGKTMIIRRLLGEHREEMPSFGGNIRKPGFAGEVKSMISELLQYDIPPKMLQEICGQLGPENRLYRKLKDIRTIYTVFHEFLGEHYITTEEVLDRLCEVIDQSLLIRGVTIYMDNFTGFTPVQYKLMRHLLTLAERVILTLPADTERDTYVMKGREELFYLTKDTMMRLERICDEMHIGREKDILLEGENCRFAQAEDIGHLEKNLFRNRILDMRGKPQHIEVISARTPVDEMACIASGIHKLVSTEHYRYSEIAVVASDMAGYARHAKYWFDRYHIPCFFDERRDIQGNMMVRWLQALLDIFIRNFSYEAVIGYLRCPFAGFSEDEVDVLENYVLAYGIRGYKKWSQVWTAKDRGMDERELARINELRSLFIEPFAVLYESIKGSDVNVHTMITAVYQYMQTLNIQEECSLWQKKFETLGDLSRVREYEQIYDVIISLFEKMDAILGREVLTVREFLDVLLSGVSEEKIGIIPPGMDQVTFGDLRRTRIDHIKVLFFAGMNDGLVPKKISPSGLITDFERETLSKLNLELAPTAKEKLCTERYYIYASLTKPSENLFISFSRQDMEGSECLPSEVIRAVKRIFPDLQEENYPDMRSADEKTDYLRAYDYMIDGLRKIASDEKPEEDWYSTFEWFHAQPEYRHLTEQLMDAAFFDHRDEQLSRAAVKAIYRGQLEGGVTMLEKYAACAYAHFLEYGLRLQERKLFQIQALDIGQLYHKSIELFSQRTGHSGYQWRDMPDDIRDRMVSECVRSVADDYNHAIMKDTMKNQYLIRRIEAITKRTVWALQQQIRKGDFDPIGYELKFKTEVETDSMHIVCGDSGEVALKGKIDRLDLCEQDGKTFVKIVDYKSGSTKFDLSRIYHGLQLQLVVYLNAADEHLKKQQHAEIVIPAGVFYYHIDDPLIEADSLEDLTFAGESAEGDYSLDDLAVLKQLSMDGLAVEDTEIIDHLDHHPEQEPKTIPVGIKKDGSYTAASSIALPENFELLRYHVRKKTQEISDAIFNGDISVKPYQYGNETPCTYCSYRAVCGFDPMMKGYRYRRLKKIDKDDLWPMIGGGQS